MAVEVLGMIFHPFPPEVDPNDLEVCKTHVANCPQWLLALAVVLWPGMPYFGSWVATRIGSRRHAIHGIVVGVLLFSGLILNISLLPYPIWFEVASLILFPVATFFAVKSARGQPSSQTEKDTMENPSSEFEKADSSWARQSSGRSNPTRY
jgi:hypothetical protein